MKKFFITIVVIFGLIIVGLAVAIYTVNLNKYKPQIEQAVKDNSGYELKINGDISTSFSPFGISIANVVVKNPQIKENQEVVKLKKLSAAIEIGALLHKEVKVKYIVLNNLFVDIKKFKNGKFNFDVVQPEQKKSEVKEKKESTENKEESSLPMININQVRIKNANINFVDLQNKTKAKISDINVAVDNIGYNSSKKGLNAISFEAKTAIKDLIFNEFNIKDISMSLNLKDSIALMNSMKLTMYDSLATAKARLDLNKKIPYLSLEADVLSFKLRSFSKEYMKKDILRGTVKVHKKFNLSLGDTKTIEKTLNGVLVVDGGDVGIKGLDIDKMVDKYNKIKDGDKSDLKSIGQLGSLLSKTGSGSGIFSGASKDATLLKHLHVETNIAKGIANLKDVAMATGKNRLAIKGKLDIVNERYMDVKVGIMDAKNCAKFSQTIQGTFTSPKIKVDKSMIDSAVNLATSLFGKITGSKAPKKKAKECTVFYNGIVKQP